jgi:hypothetical protein
MQTDEIDPDADSFSSAAGRLCVCLCERYWSAVRENARPRAQRERERERERERDCARWYSLCCEWDVMCCKRCVLCLGFRV